MFLLKIDKRKRFVFHSILAMIYIYFAAYSENMQQYTLLYMTLLFTFINIAIAHYPNIGIKNILLVILNPLALAFGGGIFLKSFPNFTITFSIISILGFGFLYYLILLSDNIFLVVSEKEELIPLYRVALTWSQILVSLVTIPLFAGIYKIPMNPLYQVLIIGILGFIFAIYQMWSVKFDTDSKKVRVGEQLLLAFLVDFLLAGYSLAISFYPMEAFLRAIVSASVLMFGLNYIASHQKNNITRKMIYQNFSVILFFTIIALIFRN